MKKERYIRLDRGTYQWKPSPAMKAAGFCAEPLGKDLALANKRARELNEQWDVFKARDKTDKAIIGVGDFNWLCKEFQADPVWYWKKSPGTRDDIDRAFERICAIIGAGKVRSFNRRQGRALYNKFHAKFTVSASEKAMKWMRRLLAYAVEIGVRDDIPIDRMTVEHNDPRSALWTPEEVQKVIQAALYGGKADSGNIIPPRRSIALATAIAYDTSMPQGDIRALTWDQWDGQGFTVIQKRSGQSKNFTWSCLRKPGT